MNRPTLVMVPCFAGAPWKLEQLAALQDWPMRSLRLRDDLDDIDRLADEVLNEVDDLDGFVLVGDSFGAVIALAVAIRRPAGLKALVISGGFARNPITSPALRALAALAPFFPGPFYRALTLRVHAFNLRSRFDREGEVPWSAARTREFFVRETPHAAYVNRVRAVRKVDCSMTLGRIDVPTLILTPQEDRLIGRPAARLLLQGIPGSEEQVLPRTGHMFRFSHPGAYSGAVAEYLHRVLELPSAAPAFTAGQAAGSSLKPYAHSA
jgi:pimeloyl-ACP methyl ester carboxylesterase